MAQHGPDLLVSIDQAVAATIERCGAVVDRWHAGEPGAWGYLAGQAILATRQALGRRLTEPERRAVWATLWRALERHAARPGSE